MSICPRCEAVASCLPCAGSLFFAAPMEPTVEKLRVIGEKYDLTTRVHGPLILEWELKCETLGIVHKELLTRLGPLEHRDTQCLLLPDGESFSPSHLSTVQTLQAFLEKQSTPWLEEMLREHRLTTAFQKILFCHDGETVYGHECLLRGSDPEGNVIFPGEIFRAAEKSDRLFYLDRAARVTAIRNAHRAGLSGRVFVNFQPSAIYDPEFCLRTTMETIWEAGFLPDQVVFEVVETDEVADVNHLLSILNYYRQAGFRIALDDVGTGYSTLGLLAELQPDYVKLDRSLVEGLDDQPHKALIAAKLLDLTKELGITSIVEGIENEGQWHWCQEQEADLVQGYFFHRPHIPFGQP